ncbi:MAG: FMN-binding protein, partial [Lachnospiraceae bacterium]|nr:FMN-binding protein [Lachnospiraceae bacterium]
MKKYMDKMKKLKNLLPLAGFIPVIVVAILVYVALDGYIPKVYEIAAAQEKETEATDAADKKNKKNRAEKKEETEKEAESTVADTAKILTQIDENAKYKDGTYFGTGKGFAGNLTVKVVISGGKIESIVITDTSDGSEFIKKASSILSAIVKGQSTNVDTVSGATYSSVGIIEAVRNALKQAVISGTDDAELNMDVTADTTMGSAETKKVPERLSTVKDDEGYKDGIYYGTGTGFAGELKVKVVIKNGKISEIEIVETKDGDEFIKSASRLLNDIVKKQSTNLDTVSGATYSSNGIIEAVRDALKGAVKN